MGCEEELSNDSEKGNGMAKVGLTQQQTTCIAELRKRMEGKMRKELFEDDTLFLRFLIARDYDLNAAQTMLDNHLNWRKLLNVDNILTDYKPVEVLKYVSLNKLGFSKEGMPVSYSSFGNIDTKGLLKILKKAEIMEYMTHNFEGDAEMMKQKSQELGKQITKFIYIFDLTNFSLGSATHKPTLEMIIQLVLLFDNNYPERLHTAFIINAPVYFTLFYAAVSPFISGATIKKIKVFGKDGWQSEILKEIDEDVLPAFLGGTRTDPDGNPRCKTFLNFGGPVPEKYFRRKSVSVSKKPGSKKLILHRKATETVEVNILYPNSVLEWEFETKSRDVAFSVLYKQSGCNEEAAEEIIPKQRVEAYISSETGMVRCEKPGIYILEFDNSYSWMHSKEVYYIVSVLKPGDEVQKRIQ